MSPTFLWGPYFDSERAIKGNLHNCIRLWIEHHMEDIVFLFFDPLVVYLPFLIENRYLSSYLYR